MKGYYCNKNGKIKDCLAKDESVKTHYCLSDDILINRIPNLLIYHALVLPLEFNVIPIFNNKWLDHSCHLCNDNRFTYSNFSE